ncbi:Hpt domain-containing protein [Sneathiella glossodoripedis]|uniref:Hpt domain-containing protein n=1 Tax=Sneathiella glossodoripedis TaxID=418853 RepID=UPI000AB3164F|nr:Hpt domain-containing protein [Sneathiella glossodoripedis]
MDDYAQFKATYFAECAELLADVETQLSELNEGSGDPEVLHAIFRAVHSIKAGAGAFKFTQLATFSHEFEALLDRMRDGRIQVTEPGVNLLFRSTDILSAMVEAAENEENLSDEYGKEILAEITSMAKGSTVDPAQIDLTQTSEDTATAPATTEQTSDEKKNYFIKFTPKAELFKHANEPLLIIRELQTLGNLTSEPNLDKLPQLSNLDAKKPIFPGISLYFQMQTLKM